MAAPTFLFKDPTVIEKLCKYIEDGVAVTLAAPACGITARTYFNWMADGEKDLEEGILSEKAAFFHRITVSKANQVRERTILIQDAGKKSEHWGANAWLNERLHPKHYGKQADELEELRKDMDLIKQHLMKSNEGTENIKSKDDEE